MDLDTVDHTAETPPYEQVRAQIAARVAAGDLAAGTRLPTVRALAEQVGLAVNTVARVYKELEADGVVVTEGRRGTFVRSGAATGSGAAGRAAAAYVDSCRAAGLTLADALRQVERGWSR